MMKQQSTIAKGPGWCEPFLLRRVSPRPSSPPPAVAEVVHEPQSPPIQDTLAAMFAQAAMQPPMPSMPHAPPLKAAGSPTEGPPSIDLAAPAMCNTVASLFAHAAQNGRPFKPMPTSETRSQDAMETPPVEAAPVMCNALAGLFAQAKVAQTSMPAMPVLPAQTTPMAPVGLVAPVPGVVVTKPKKLNNKARKAKAKEEAAKTRKEANNTSAQVESDSGYSGSDTDEGHMRFQTACCS